MPVVSIAVSPMRIEPLESSNAHDVGTRARDRPRAAGRERLLWSNLNWRNDVRVLQRIPPRNVPAASTGILGLAHRHSWRSARVLHRLRARRRLGVPRFFIAATGVAIGIFLIAWGWIHIIQIAAGRAIVRERSRPVPVPHDPSVPPSGPGGFQGWISIFSRSDWRSGIPTDHGDDRLQAVA